MTLLRNRDDNRVSYSEFVQLLEVHAIPAREITTEHIKNILSLLSNSMTTTTTTPSPPAAAATAISSTSFFDLDTLTDWLYSDTMKHLIAGGKELEIYKLVALKLMKKKNKKFNA